MVSHGEALHRSLEVIDGLQISDWGETVFRNMRKGGLTAVHATVSVLENFRETVQNLIRWHGYFETYADLIMPVTRVSDIAAAKEADKTGIVFGFQNTSPIEDDIGLLTVFHALGVRIVQLTYMEANLVGQGCLERVDAGLTNFGLSVVEEMNRLGMLIDLSHVGHRTTMDAIEASEQPVVFTHANPRSLKDHPRNKPDEAIRDLARKGGVIGATLFPPFLPGGPEPGIEEVVAVIEHLVQMVGIDHVAIGTDFTEGRPRAFFDWLLAGKAGRGAGMELEYPLRLPKGFQTSADFPNLTEALVKRGYADADVQKIMGGNLLRLFGKVWGS